MPETFDYIVLGVGGFGSATLYHLASRGLRVLGIERFDVPHDRGSSHGESRIIRKAYIEHPDYVPLVNAAYDLWAELEAESCEDLFHRTGLVLSGLPGGIAIQGTRLAAVAHRLPIEVVELDEARRRFPGFDFPADFAVMFDPEAGYLRVEHCVAAHARCAVARGAEIRTGEAVRSWSSDGPRVRVDTDRGSYEAGGLVITAGAWASTLLAGLSVSLQVVRKPVFWHRKRGSMYDLRLGTPTFYFDLGERHFYGFPSIDGATVKVSEHTGGEPIDDPLEVARGVTTAETAAIAEFVRQCLPHVEPQPVRHSVCLYTLTADHHFIVDVHPEYENVVIGAGFSGHGFKFTPVLGAAMADLAVERATGYPIGFLSLDRESLRD